MTLLYYWFVLSFLIWSLWNLRALPWPHPSQCTSSLPKASPGSRRLWAWLLTAWRCHARIRTPPLKTLHSPQELRSLTEVLGCDRKKTFHQRWGPGLGLITVIADHYWPCHSGHGGGDDLELLWCIWNPLLDLHGHWACFWNNLRETEWLTSIYAVFSISTLSTKHFKLTLVSTLRSRRMDIFVDDHIKWNQISEFQKIVLFLGFSTWPWLRQALSKGPVMILFQPSLIAEWNDQPSHWIECSGTQNFLYHFSLFFLL